jgi:hypothetical protein
MIVPYVRIQETVKYSPWRSTEFQYSSRWHIGLQFEFKKIREL